MKNNTAKHSLGWLVYGMYLYFLNILTEDSINIVSLFLYLLPFIGIFYVFLSIFRTYKNNKVKGIILVILLFAAFLGISYGLLIYIFPYFGVNLIVGNFKIQAFVQEVIRGFIQFFIYALLFFIIEEFLKKERKMLDLEREKHKLELENIRSQKEKLQYQYAFLRAQINPHFLYNTLNVLYSQALPISEKLADNIMKVSDLMRYSLDNVEMENNRIPVSQEIEHLNILISIYNMRYSNSIYIEKNINGDLKHHYIAPLSFITIVENAFKYGDLSNSQYPVIINIDFNQDYFKFSCKNKKKKNVANIISHNIGLSNLEQRLNFSFENKWAIQIHDNENFYTLELIIKK